MSSSSTGIARVRPAGRCRRACASARDALREEPGGEGAGSECRRRMSSHASRSLRVDECRRDCSSGSLGSASVSSSAATVRARGRTREAGELLGMEGWWGQLADDGRKGQETRTVACHRFCVPVRRLQKAQREVLSPHRSPSRRAASWWARASLAAGAVVEVTGVQSWPALVQERPGACRKL